MFGTGAFLVVGLATLFGYSLRRATANAKLINFASNLGSLAFFILGGKVVWAAGFAMAAGQVIGARLGAIAVLRKGARIVRPLVVITAVGMALAAVMKPARHRGGQSQQPVRLAQQHNPAVAGDMTTAKISRHTPLTTGWKLDVQ